MTHGDARQQEVVIILHLNCNMNRASLIIIEGCDSDSDPAA